MLDFIAMQMSKVNREKSYLGKIGKAKSRFKWISFEKSQKPTGI